MAGTMTDRDLKALFANAHAAGMAAGTAVVPEPMYVVERVNPLDDTSAVKRAYPPVMDGVCGFAWVTIKPGTSRAAKYAKKALGARKGYYGGMEIWVAGFGQSLTRKEAYAEAFAKVLRDAGVTAYAGSRMD